MKSIIKKSEQTRLVENGRKRSVFVVESCDTHSMLQGSRFLLTLLLVDFLIVSMGYFRWQE